MATRLMKAVRVAQLGGPEVLKLLSDVPVPSPQQHQVLIKVHAAGVNPVDTYIRSGTHTYRPPLPYTPGHDVAGVVEEVGNQVSKFKPGDRVFTMRTLSGGYAEFSLAEERYTFSLHDSLTYPQGAALGIAYFTAYRAIFIRGQAKAGETILIHGASGGVGLAACQLSHAHGLVVLGTAGSQAGRDLVAKNGATQVYDHYSQDYCQQILADTDGRGVDIIIEMLANVNLEKDLPLLTTHGRVMVVGNRGRIEIDPRVTMGKETDIRGVMVMTGTQEDLDHTGEVILSGQKQGWCRPVVGLEFGLHEAPEAQTEVMRQSRGTEGKIILTP